MSINALLIIVAAILILCVVLGIRKGFVHTVFSMFSLLIIVIVTGLLSTYVAAYINDHTDIPSKIRNKVATEIKLENQVDLNTSGKLEEYIDTISMPEQLKDLLVSKSKEAGDVTNTTSKEAASSMVGNIYDRISELIVNAIAYLFTFAVVAVVVLVAGLLLDIVAKLPGIRQANEVLGAIIGLVQGYLIVSVLYVFAIAFAATGFGEWVIKMVNENQILTWFYAHNPIVELLFGLL